MKCKLSWMSRFAFYCRPPVVANSDFPAISALVTITEINARAMTNDPAKLKFAPVDSGDAAHPRSASCGTFSALSPTKG